MKKHWIGLYKSIITLTWEIKKASLTLLVINSILTGLQPFIPFVFSALILDELLGTQDPERLILYTSLLISLTLVIRLITSWLVKKQDLLRWEVFFGIDRKLCGKFMTMDYEYTEKEESHNLIRKMYESNNVRGGINSLFQSTETCLTAFIEILISLTLLVRLLKAGNSDGGRIIPFINSLPALLLFVFMLILSLFLYSHVNNKRGGFRSGMMDLFIPLNRVFFYVLSRIGSHYQNGKDIRLYNAQDFFADQGEKLQRDMAQKTVKYLIKNGVLYNSILTIINNISFLFIYLFIVLKAYTGVISLGSVLLQINGIGRFYKAVSLFIDSYNHLKMGVHYFESTLLFLNLPDLKYRGTLPVEKREDNKYILEFRNVSFQYPGTDEFVLKNINLTISIGERLAVVGMNGAGKTTMIKLLCRLYDPAEGEILLNGINIKKYDYLEYLSLFSVVFQDYHLFQFSLEDNITLSTDPDRNLLKESLEKSGLEERVEALPLGTGTYMGRNFNREGVDFSGGEQQKTAIARALYKQAPIVVLDEPTAGLDPISEYDIYTKFDTLVGNKTAIYISHRLSSCRFCYNIIVFHEGMIIQRGSHDNLLKNKEGKYHELWSAQAGYYNK